MPGPYAKTNINVNGRWYDYGDDLSDCSKEEIDDLTEKDAVSKLPLIEEEEEADGEVEDASAKADKGTTSGDDVKAKEGKGN